MKQRQYIKLAGAEDCVPKRADGSNKHDKNPQHTHSVIALLLGVKATNAADPRMQWFSLARPSV